MTTANPTLAADIRRADVARPKLGALASTGAFVHRSVIHTLRTPDAIMMAIALPTILMLMFTFVFGGAFDPSGGYVDYVVPGIILLCAGFGASSIAVDVAPRHHHRHHRPVPHHAVAGIDRHHRARDRDRHPQSGRPPAIVIGVALLVGFRPNATPIEWIAAILLIAAYILAITYLFAAIGLASSSPEAACGYGFILMFVPYLSSAFVPIQTMPEWLQPIARINPVTPIIETIRGLLMGTEIGTQGLWAVGWILGILGFAIVWTSWLFARRSGRR